MACAFARTDSFLLSARPGSNDRLQWSIVLSLIALNLSIIIPYQYVDQTNSGEQPFKILISWLQLGRRYLIMSNDNCSADIEFVIRDLPYVSVRNLPNNLQDH